MALVHCLLVSLLLCVVSATYEPVCKTKPYGFGLNNAKCVFPFKYKGKEYHTCTAIDCTDNWCATKYEYDDNSWGFCNDDCPFACRTTLDGYTPCLFPFSYRGYYYDRCITEDHDVPWCTTSRSWEKPNWGECKSYCPVQQNKQLSALVVKDLEKKVASPHGGYINYDLPMVHNADVQCVPEPGSFLSVGHHTVMCTASHKYSYETCKNHFKVDVKHAVCATFDYRKCVFPFWYKGQRYDECTHVDCEGCWCSTEKYFTEGSGNWGFCNHNCKQCENPCDHITCHAKDECHDAGVCDPGTGQCSNPAKEEGTKCGYYKKCYSGVCGGNP